MSRSWLSEVQPDVISKATLVIFGVVLLIAIGTGGKAFFSAAQTKATDTTIVGLNNELREMQGSMKHVNEVLASGTQAMGQSGKPIVVKFQTAVERTARDNKVRVEFTQVGDPALFLSRFKNEPDSTMQQIEVQMTLSGTLAEVTRTLDQFASFRIPFEFGEMTISRDTSVSGAGKVSARATAYVLVPNQV